jgi:PAS domain S-box-containing protein
MKAESNRQSPDLRQAADGGNVIAPSSIGPFQDFSTLWQMAFDATDDMISVLDLHHRIIAVNKAMAQALECTPEDAVGRHCFDLLHKDDKPPKACPHMALLEDGRAHRSEIYDAKLDVWLQVDVTPLYDANQELAGSIHIARDITRQKRSEQAYRESEERYRHLSEATMEGVLLSQGSIIIAANQVLADMMGYAVKELIGMNMLKFVAPGHRHRLVQMLRKRSLGAYAFDCIRKDGTLFSMEARSRIISYKGGMVFQTAIRDLTDQIRIERERSQHERMRGVMEMAGAICHEINQPLMALQGFMTIMSGRLQLPEDAQMHLDRMAEQVGRLKTLTRKIMRITKYATKDYPGGEKIIDIDQSSPEEIR